MDSLSHKYLIRKYSDICQNIRKHLYSSEKGFEGSCRFALYTEGFWMIATDSWRLLDEFQ